jgi:hypothetical protein
MISLMWCLVLLLCWGNFIFASTAAAHRDVTEGDSFPLSLAAETRTRRRGLNEDNHERTLYLDPQTPGLVKTVKSANTAKPAWYSKEKPYGNVVFLMTKGRSGSSFIVEVIDSLTNSASGSELIGRNKAEIIAGKPIELMRKWILKMRTDKYKNEPNKVLVFKWKAYADTPNVIEGLKWAKKNGFVAVYNTRNELDVMVSNMKMQENVTHSYSCQKWDKKCIEMNKNLDETMNIKTLVNELDKRRKDNLHYEKLMNDTYGFNNYVHVTYDWLTYAPKEKDRLGHLQQMADQIFDRLTPEAAKTLRRKVTKKDYKGTKHTETHYYEQWRAIANFEEVFETLRGTPYANLLHGPSNVPLDTSLGYEAAKKKSVEISFEP